MCACAGTYTVKNEAIFEVFTAVLIKMSVFLDIKTSDGYISDKGF